MAYQLKLENDPGWMGNPKRGSGMGRPNTLPENRLASPVLHLTRMRMTDGGDYDTGAAYWGAGDAKIGYMYAAETDAEQSEYARIFVRARDRQHAKTLIERLLPHARFFLCPQDTDDLKNQVWDMGRDDALSGKVQDNPYPEYTTDYRLGYQCGLDDRETMK